MKWETRLQEFRTQAPRFGHEKFGSYQMLILEFLVVLTSVIGISFVWKEFCGLITRLQEVIFLGIPSVVTVWFLIRVNINHRKFVVNNERYFGSVWQAIKKEELEAMTENGATASIEAESLEDHQLLLLLERRVEELETSLKRVERREHDISVLRRDIIFTVSIVAMLAALVLTIAPYLGLSQQPIPSVISYVSAFVVLFFAYFVYRAFGASIAARELKQATLYALEDGHIALERAQTVLARARREAIDA